MRSLFFHVSQAETVASSQTHESSGWMTVISQSVKTETLRSLARYFMERNVLRKENRMVLLQSPQTALNRNRVGNCIGKETTACAKLCRFSSAPASPSSGSYLAPDVLTCQGVWTSVLRALLLLSISLDPLSTAGTDACTPGFPQTLLAVPLFSVFSICLWPVGKCKHKTMGVFFC